MHVFIAVYASIDDDSPFSFMEGLFLFAELLSFFRIKAIINMCAVLFLVIGGKKIDGV